MTQRDLNRCVAQLTGEAVSTIEARGFSILDPATARLDDDLPIIDWDVLATERIGIFSDRQQRITVA